MSHPDSTNWGTVNSSYTLLATRITSTLANGANGAVTAGNIQTAFNKVANPDSEDVSLIITGPATEPTIENAISIAETRKDCVVFCSPEKADVVDNSGSEENDVTAFRDTVTSSSYAVMDSGWKYQYDKYNDVYRWVPLNGDIAGLCARTDLERDPWFSPAGTARGVIKNVIKLAWNPTKANRDVLYNRGINPVVTFQGEGTVLFGDKTLLSRPSAFDRINVRRLFITLEKAIARAARSSLFEFNDAFTRSQFVNLIEPYLRDVQGRRGITDFRVVCDDTNNTAAVIDRNEFVGDIYIKPARSINFIQLNFVAVRSGVAFEEIVGRAV
jgi:phage tail sheath protein FI